MAAITIDEAKLKDLVKNALLEILETRRDFVQDIFEDAIEDFAFSRAIEEGMKSEQVSKKEVFAILEDEK